MTNDDPFVTYIDNSTNLVLTFTQIVNVIPSGHFTFLGTYTSYIQQDLMNTADAQAQESACFLKIGLQTEHSESASYSDEIWSNLPNSFLQFD